MFTYIFPNLQIELEVCADDFYKTDDNRCWIEVIRHSKSQKIYLYGEKHLRGYFEFPIIRTKPIIDKTKILIDCDYEGDIKIRRFNPNKPFIYNLKLYSFYKNNLNYAIENISKKIEPYEKIRFLQNL